MPRFTRKIDFASLGILDLIQARDSHHKQLANLPNVIGTAIGRYLIRNDDPRLKDPNAPEPKVRGPRTIDKVTVANWSWPAVLVFVNKWQDPTDFAHNMDGYIPARIYLEDGRAVPTCVVAAPSLPRSERTMEQPHFALTRTAAGNALMRDAQEQERIGTVSCLVTDGADMYALTNGHVIGSEGEDLFGFDEVGHRKQIAIASATAQRSIVFSEAYPDWPAVRTFLTADVGIAKITDVADWDARLADGRRMGPVINLSVDTLNLDLINCPLFGYGAASGAMKGQVMALFYRYRSIGGSDYVADILIGPREEDQNVPTRPGDSGAIWLWDAQADIDSGKADPKDEGITQAVTEPRPLAVQWGGYASGGGSGTGSQSERQFALATSLSLACRLLDVEFIQDLGYERGQYWGKTGHYKVAWSACELVHDEFLSDLLSANQDRISVSDADLMAGTVPMNNAKTFIALADIADLYWRSARPNDAANHFADMDQPKVEDPDNPGRDITLLEAWDDPDTRTTDYWTRYYKSAGTDSKHMGALPFRAWEVFDLLVEYARDAKLTEFVCAAGCVGHYIGDACQPLHVSYLHHGNPDKPEESPVHSTYETKMLDRFVNDLVAGVNSRLKGSKPSVKKMRDGSEAADHVVTLMRETLNRIPPQSIIDLFDDNPGRTRLQKMWEKLDDPTMDCIAEGAKALAQYWEAAWLEGRSDPGAVKLPKKAAAIDETDLMALYRDKTFMPSKLLNQMKLPK
jgi:hypothetical protein